MDDNSTPNNNPNSKSYLPPSIGEIILPEHSLIAVQCEICERHFAIRARTAELLKGVPPNKLTLPILEKNILLTHACPECSPHYKIPQDSEYSPFLLLPSLS